MKRELLQPPATNTWLLHVAHDSREMCAANSYVSWCDDNNQHCDECNALFQTFKDCKEDCQTALTTVAPVAGWLGRLPPSRAKPPIVVPTWRKLLIKTPSLKLIPVEVSIGDKWKNLLGFGSGKACREMAAFKKLKWWLAGCLAAHMHSLLQAQFFKSNTFSG